VAEYCLKVANSLSVSQVSLQYCLSLLRAKRPRMLCGSLESFKRQGTGSRMNDIELEAGGNELNAFYAGLRRAGKGPSTEHPCARCHSPESLARVLGGELPTASKLDRGIRFQGLMDDVNDRDLPKGYVTALVFGSETESTKRRIRLRFGTTDSLHS